VANANAQIRTRFDSKDYTVSPAIGDEIDAQRNHQVR
jgi:hypothetical protein